jgi:hypothetical protein
MIKTPGKAVCLFKIDHMGKSLDERSLLSLNKTVIFQFFAAPEKTRGAAHDGNFRVQNGRVLPWSNAPRAYVDGGDFRFLPTA